MAVFYLAIAYPRFCPDITFVGEHMLVLAVWLTTTALLMFLTRDVLIRIHLRMVFIPFVVLPALSCYFLFIIYVVSLMGSFFWGSPSSYRIVLQFGPHLFDLADNFDVPRFLVIGIVVLPFAGFMAIFFGRVREMIIWHWSLRESFMTLGRRHRWKLSSAATLIWLFLLTVIVTTDSTIAKFGYFHYDPIVRFFKTNRNFFPMTAERLLCIRKDQEFEKHMRPRPPRVHNIILIVVDALRADHLPDYGYPRPLTPFFSKFLRTANVQKVDLTLSNGLDTLTGLQCLLTSKEPMSASQFDYTLPDFLSGNGFKNYLTLAGGHSWQKQNHAFGDQIDFFYDGSEHPGPGGICDDEVALAGLSKLKPDDGSYHFLYIHLISVHQLSNIKNFFLRYKPAHNIVNLVFTGSKDDESLTETANMYDDKIIQLDDSLKKVFSILKEKGYLKDYVAALTADHGQLLGEKGRYGHGYYASFGGMRVPLIFFGSKPLPRLRQPHFAVQLDVAPTLTDLAGLGYATCWQGQSLLRPRTNPWSYHCSVQPWEGHEGAVVYTGDSQILKYERPIGESEMPGNLYDLEKDPKENEDLVGRFDSKNLNDFRSRFNEHFLMY